MANILLKNRRDPLVVVRALADSMDLTMFDVAKLLTPSTQVPAAAWGYDPQDEKEKIWLNWEKLATLPDDELLWMVRHETLHRAVYDEHYEFQDKELGMLAMDIAINKILFLANPELSVRATRHVYPEETTESALALARCDLQRDQIPQKFQPVWDEIWGDDRVPSVYPIYFALQLDKDKIEEQRRRGQSGFGDPRGGEGEGEPEEEDEEGGGEEEKEGPPPPRQPSMFDEDGEGNLKPKEELTRPPKPRSKPRPTDGPVMRGLPDNPVGSEVMDRAAKEARDTLDKVQARGIPDGGGFSRTFSKFFKKLGLTKEKTHTEEIEEFLSQIRGKDEADDAISRLMAALGLEPRVEVVPGQLTTTGVFMAAAGVSARTGVWWNEVPFERRPKLRIYVDTSPSMSDWATRTVYIIDTLKDELPATMYGFAGDVRECQTEDFARGEYYRGGSTYFDGVVEDICDHDEELALIITDGESSVSEHNKRRARASGKMIFTILCGSKGDNRYNGKDLRDISLETMSLFEKPKRGR